MKQIIKPTLAAGIGVLVLIANSRSASAAIDSAAAEVLLRKTCTDNGATLNNCFESVSALNAWITNTRHPWPINSTSAPTPLHVRIGAGSFSGTIECGTPQGQIMRGYVTYTGAGVGNSIVENVNNSGCTNLTFENLTVKAPASAFFAVREKGGVSVWKNVELISPGYAWFDQTSPYACGDRGEHYFFSSRLVTTGMDSTFVASEAVFDECEELWFHGSEITSMADTSGTLHTLHVDNGEAYVFGGVIRAIPNFTELPDDPPAAVHAGFDAKVEIHGTGIEIEVPTTGYPSVTAIYAYGNAVVDANGASYQLRPAPGGTITRLSINDQAKVKAPYLWHNGTQPPAGILSQTGADMMVVTTGGTPHLLIYKAGCSGSSNWYDPVTASCF